MKRLPPSRIIHLAQNLSANPSSSLIESYAGHYGYSKRSLQRHFQASARTVTLHYLGKGIYNHLEDYPYAIGNTLKTWLQNSYSLTAVKPIFSLYTTIHKAIRQVISDVCILAGQTDFSDSQAAALFTDKFTLLLKLLRIHSIYESTFICLSPASTIGGNEYNELLT